jgi:hypothetical protein
MNYSFFVNSVCSQYVKESTKIESVSLLFDVGRVHIAVEKKYKKNVFTISIIKPNKKINKFTICNCNLFLEGKNLVPFFSGKNRIIPPAKSMVFHYDSTQNVDVLGRTVINNQWRYTEWDGGKRGTELYIHKNDPKEYINQVNDQKTQKFAIKGKAVIANSQVPKTAEANRPRALLKPGMKTN